ncbi:MAG: DNA polymerase III subunit gamma/tau [Bacteroidales bacterium]|nr:DNA polymerase III subunit gamma/tau [Bacteroidales bacterium]
MNPFVVSARKYRPQQFNDVVDQDNIVATLKNAISRKQLAHAYLFCGPRGVGKTTCARIFARTINCFNPTQDTEACGECESCKSFAEGRSYSIHELDAASNNSVDDIRELIDKVRIPPQIGKHSVYIIDEVHMLSQSAFNAFLKTLEEPPSYALFILATTEKHKVLPTVLSRCQVFDFNRISIKAMMERLAQVAQNEGVTIGRDSLHVMAQKADGAMRDALTLLDQCIAVSGKNITYEQVIDNLNVLDREYYFRLTDMALEGKYEGMLLLLDEILSRGFNALHFIGGLASHFRDLLVCKQPKSLPLLEYGPDIAEKYTRQAEACSPLFLFHALNICTQTESAYKESSFPRLHLEVALVKLSRLAESERSAAQKTVGVQSPVASAATPALTDTTTATPAATDTSATSSAPTDTAATTPAAAASATTPASGAAPPSIKDRIHQREKAREEDKELNDQPLENLIPNEEDLKKVLPGFFDLFKNKPNLSATLSRCEPQIVEGTKIQFRVVNELQKSWIEEHYGRVINSYLRTALKNKQVCMSLVVEESNNTPTGNNCYMPEERIKFLAEKHPEVAKLRKDLHLDIS